jgi:hypothetical protein
MSIRRSGMMGLGSVAAPMVLFLGLKVFLGLGPASSPAADVADPAMPPPGPPEPMTPEQARALAWLAELQFDPDMASPLNHPHEQPGEVAPAPVVVAPDPLEGLRLGAVLSTGDSGWATINGTLYRVGQTVVDGFSLRSIDARAQEVELVGPDGISRWLARGE